MINIVITMKGYACYILGKIPVHSEGIQMTDDMKCMKTAVHRDGRNTDGQLCALTIHRDLQEQQQQCNSLDIVMCNIICLLTDIYMYASLPKSVSLSLTGRTS